MIALPISWASNCPIITHRRKLTTALSPQAWKPFANTNFINQILSVSKRTPHVTLISAQKITPHPKTAQNAPNPNRLKSAPFASVCHVWMPESPFSCCFCCNPFIQHPAHLLNGTTFHGLPCTFESQYLNNQYTPERPESGVVLVTSSTNF
jgi:hypothetical protein